MNSKDQLKQMQKVAIPTGILITLGLILYFLIMSAFGLHKTLNLRYFNLVILIAGIFLGLKTFKSKKQEDFGYLEGLNLGIFITAISSLLFGAFIFLYLSINSEFMMFLKENAMMGEYLNPTRAAFIVIMEGLSSGLVISLLAMQLFKNTPEYEERRRRIKQRQAGLHSRIQHTGRES